MSCHNQKLTKFSNVYFLTGWEIFLQAEALAEIVLQDSVSVLSDDGFSFVSWHFRDLNLPLNQQLLFSANGPLLISHLHARLSHVNESF